MFVTGPMHTEVSAEPAELREFLKRWIELFNDGDWDGLASWDVGKPEPSKSHAGYLYGAGYRAVRTRIHTYTSAIHAKFPRTYFSPQPEYWCEIEFQSADGETGEIFLALARDSTHFFSATVELRAPTLVEFVKEAIFDFKIWLRRLRTG
jgi:hypothetical protein